MSDVVPFCDAVVGQSAYTWEIADDTTGDGWGEYRFETVDPLTTHSRYDWDGDPPTMIRKRWVLAEVETVEFEADDEPGDDE